MIIVLAGAMGSGKDTIGDILVKNYNFTKIAFADPLKKMVKLAFPAFTDEDLYGPSSRRATQYPQYPFSGYCIHCGLMCFDEYTKLLEDRNVTDGMRYYCAPCDMSYPEFVSPRLALQSLGTEWGRRLYPNVWVDAAFENIRKNDSKTYVMDGSMQEKHWITRNWAITDCRFKNEVEGSRKNDGLVVRLTRNMDVATTSHASEAELKTIPLNQFDYVLDNALCDLAGLPEEVERMLSYLNTRSA